MQKVTHSILILTSCYLAFLFYAFGVFLQHPVVEGELLTVQAVVEPLIYLLTMVVGNFAIYRAVFSQEKPKKLFFDEKKLIVPTITLLMLIAFGAGMHTTGQLIEETFVNSGTSTQHTVSNFTSQVAYFLEEYPAHFLVAIPYTILLFFLGLVEFNRKSEILRSIERSIIVICAILYGVVFAIANFEGHVVSIIVPLNIYLMYRLFRAGKDSNQNIFNKPFSIYFVVGTMTMITLSLALGFVFGWSTQPTELGLGSILSN